ncbi:hypothetical protein F5Y04DRAFT_284778 [Hypomontagnella monticulosa]|nr:hypothetical protein F5Y04DRAFT_284778 [Hypomontagnella monticulosa]
MPPKAQPRNRLNLARTNVLMKEITDQNRDQSVYIHPRWLKANVNNDLPPEWRDSLVLEYKFDTFQQLQASRTFYLDAAALDLCLELLDLRFPIQVRDDVNIVTSTDEDEWAMQIGMDGFHAFLNTIFLRDKPKGWQRTPAAYRELYQKPYHFWPIDVSAPANGEAGRWVTAIIRLEREKNKNPDYDENDPNSLEWVESNEYLFYRDIVIVDPSLDNDNLERSAITRRKVRDFLESCGLRRSPNFDANREIWVPPTNQPQDFTDNNMEVWSTGLRCVDVVRQMMTRILDSYVADPYRDIPDDVFFAPLRGWFVADDVRTDMIALVAMDLVSQLGYNARIAIEPVKKLNCGNKVLKNEGLRPVTEGVTAPHMYVPGSKDLNGCPLTWDTGDGDSESLDTVYGVAEPDDNDQGGGGTAAYAQARIITGDDEDDTSEDDVSLIDRATDSSDIPSSDEELDPENESETHESTEESDDGVDDETSQGSSGGDSGEDEEQSADSEEDSVMGDVSDDPGSDFGESSGLSRSSQKRKNEEYDPPVVKKPRV